MKLCTLSTGDTVHRYYKNLIIMFNRPRKVLSTSVYNGGYSETLAAVFNHDCNPGAGMACTLRAPTYEEHMRLIAGEAGLNPDRVTGMATAASMDNVAVCAREYENLTVTALVTGGIEVNGGRAGDPATHFQPLEKEAITKPGTINIMLVIDADLPAGVLARALVTCTEAKTAALQELLADSRYSSGLATGSGTDQTIIIANPASPLYLESAGKHSKLGELIGLAVKQAVKEALQRQTGLSPAKQHSVLRRCRRYGITEETVWQSYQARGAESLSKALFMEHLHALDKETSLVTYASLYIHLLDQMEWELLTPAAVADAAGILLGLAAARYKLSAPAIPATERQGFAQAWTDLLADLVRQAGTDFIDMGMEE